MGVEEGDCGREVVVVVDEVGEVGHRLVALVKRGFKFVFVVGGGSRGIYNIEGSLPTRRKSGR